MQNLGVNHCIHVVRRLLFVQVSCSVHSHPACLLAVNANIYLPFGKKTFAENHGNKALLRRL